MKNREQEIKKNWNKARKEEGLKAAKMTVDTKKNPTVNVDPYDTFTRSGGYNYDMNFNSKSNNNLNNDDDQDVRTSKILALPEPKKEDQKRAQNSESKKSNATEVRSSNKDTFSATWKQLQGDESGSEIEENFESILDILD